MLLVATALNMEVMEIKIKHYLLETNLDKIKPYLIDTINDMKTQDEWEIKLKMVINLYSSKEKK